MRRCVLHPTILHGSWAFLLLLIPIHSFSWLLWSIWIQWKIRCSLRSFLFLFSYWPINEHWIILFFAFFFIVFFALLRLLAMNSFGFFVYFLFYSLWRTSLNFINLNSSLHYSFFSAFISSMAVAISMNLPNKLLLIILSSNCIRLFISMGRILFSLYWMPLSPRRLPTYLLPSFFPFPRGISLFLYRVHRYIATGIRFNKLRIMSSKKAPLLL